MLGHSALEGKGLPGLKKSSVALLDKFCARFKYADIIETHWENIFIIAVTLRIGPRSNIHTYITTLPCSFIYYRTNIIACKVYTVHTNIICVSHTLIMGHSELWSITSTE